MLVVMPVNAHGRTSEGLCFGKTARERRSSHVASTRPLTLTKGRIRTMHFAPGDDAVTGERTMPENKSAGRCECRGTTSKDEGPVLTLPEAPGNTNPKDADGQKRKRVFTRKTNAAGLSTGCERRRLS